MSTAITQKHIIVSVLAGFFLTIGISAFLASIAKQNEIIYGTSASILTGIVGGTSDTAPTTTAPIICGNEIYGLCPSQNACIQNPIGDYYCAKIRRAACPTGAECTPCSQLQLERCVKNNPHTSSCAIAKNTSDNTTICSNE